MVAIFVPRRLAMAAQVAANSGERLAVCAAWFRTQRSHAEPCFPDVPVADGEVRAADRGGQPGPAGQRTIPQVPFPLEVSDETTPTPLSIARCGRRDDEKLDVTVAFDLIAVLDTARPEHAAAAGDLESIVAASQSDGSLENAENLVLRRMGMVRRLLACPSRVLGDGQPPALALLSRLDREVDIKVVRPARSGVVRPARSGVVRPALPGPEGIRDDGSVAHE
jgi:hypothetical protein